ncbi:MFS transporter [Pseudofrankia asymbiotica]|uniref:MFS transporter n=1 Tax=Pseudofrankia asymbiotica TaxID=1834516 RepID=A0A1V2HZX2_9ACTN|nr:MFS transporter [Pseudofrankia asymbiotica]
MLAATFMYAFDTNVVNVALPSLQRHLHAGPGALELVVGGYAFAYAAGLVTGGRLGDLCGYRRLFLAGMAAFTLASGLCGLAATPGELVGARIVQGLAAAVMVPQVLALITVTFDPRQRPGALAWFGVLGAIGSVAGQVLGGVIIDADIAGLGWRAVFLVNLPVGIIVLIIARMVLPHRYGNSRVTLDPVGVLGISGALALALIPLTLGHGQGWPLWTWVSLGASLPVMLAALGYERRLARRGRAPLVDLSLFASRGFSAGLGIATAFMAFFASSLFVLSLLLQIGLGLSALHAGLSFGPFCLAAVATALVGRKLIARLGARTVIRIGCAISASGTIVLAGALAAAGGQVATGWVIGGLGVIGAGNSMILTAYLGATLATVRPDQAGAVSGTLNTIQQFAAATGLAVIGAVFYAVLGHHPTPGRYASGAETVAWIGLGLIGVIAVLTTLLPTQPELTPAVRSTPTAADEPAAEPASS